MSAEAPRRAPMLSLRELVDRYRAVAGAFGQPAALSVFGLSQEEAERLFSSFEEDYHIGRFFHFSESEGPRFAINGFPATHVSLDEAITSIL